MKHFDAIVVGAGAAGLLAARELARAGLSVALIEARDRAGGRIDTRRSPGLEAPVELGAEFVHGWPEISLELLREAGESIVATGQEQATVVDGALVRTGDERFEAVTRLFERIDPDAPDEPLDAFLERVAASPSMAQTRAYARTMVEGFDAADPAVVSVHSLREEWLGAASIDEGSYRPARGYGVLVDHLERQLDELRVEKRFATRVDRIAWNDGAVAIDTRAGDSTLRFEAKHAVITVPIGVLQARAMTFEPELPYRTTCAMDALAMGPVVKIVLQFDERFWERARGVDLADVAFFQSSETPFTTIWTPMPPRVPMLVAWAGGARAYRFRGLDEGARLDRAIDSIASIFGISNARVREHLVSSYDHDWQSDPCAFGAYSYALVGAGDARTRLAQPVGPLHFAGEATASTAQAGTVAGAFQSALRAVAEITNAPRAERTS